MPREEEWDVPDLDSLMKSETKHEWISEPRYKRMFDDIEDALQGVMGKGRFEWVDRRVFDQVFDRLTLLALHKLMQQGEIETIDYPIARGKEAHVFHATSKLGPLAVKIFHTTNAVFKGLAKYIDGDPRFSGLSRRHREREPGQVNEERAAAAELDAHERAVALPAREAHEVVHEGEPAGGSDQGQRDASQGREGLVQASRQRAKGGVAGEPQEDAEGDLAGVARALLRLRSFRHRSPRQCARL